MTQIQVDLLQETGPRNPGRLEATLLQLPRKKQGLPSSDNDLRPSPQNWSGNTESQNQTQTRSTSSMQQKVSRQSAFSKSPWVLKSSFYERRRHKHFHHKQSLLGQEPRLCRKLTIESKTRINTHPLNRDPDPLDAFAKQNFQPDERIKSEE